MNHQQSPSSGGSKTPSAKPTEAMNDSSTFPSADFDPDEYKLRKLLPPKFNTAKNHLYVTEKTNFKSQLARCAKLLDKEGFEFVVINGLGGACNRAINIALQLVHRNMGALEISVNTSTVNVADEMIPLLDDGVSQIRQRFVSAVHIRLFKTLTPASLPVKLIPAATS